MRVLVTGATGFVGRRVVRHLQLRHDTVLTLGRRPCDIDGVDHVALNATEPDALVAATQALRGQAFDAVIHLAAAGVHPGDRDDATLTRVNTVLPAAMVAAAATHGAKAVVIAGSSAEYRASPTAVSTDVALDEQSPLETTRLYGASKAAGSILALAHGAARDIPVGVLRLFNIFGPGEAPHRLLPSLLDSLDARRGVKLSAGTQVRDFVYIDDACAAILAALDALAGGTMASAAYNVATGVGNSVADFARAAAQLAGADPALLEFGALPMRPDDLQYVVGDASLLRSATGWSPRFTMEQGIATTIAERQATPSVTRQTIHE